MKFSALLEIVWDLACKVAVESGFGQIEPEHFVIAMCRVYKTPLDGFFVQAEENGENGDDLREEISILSVFLDHLKLDVQTLQNALEGQLGQGDYHHHHHDVVIHRSPASLKMFQDAQEYLQAVIKDEEFKVLQLGFLLCGYLDTSRPSAQTICSLNGTNPQAIKKELLRRLIRCYKTKKYRQESQKESQDDDTPFLDKFGRNLCRLASAGKLNGFFGREDLLQELIEIFARRGRCNAILIGEPGVGKTALVEALAGRIAQGNVPDYLKNCKIIQIEIGHLLAGTKYRGDFEDAMSQIIKECAAHPNIILFIDEIHTLIGAGLCEGQTLDASNMLKPALARKEIRCIGSTTLWEYRRHIEPDRALSRRFEKVVISEPTAQETLLILKKLAMDWELEYDMTIPESLLRLAIDLTVEFESDRFLPDKAIDLVDRAAAAVYAKRKSGVAHDCGELSAQDLANILARRVHLPVDFLVSETNVCQRMKRLSILRRTLRKKIYGQDQAIDAICRRLEVSYAGLTSRRGPLAAMLFLGPTGVGKTETAISLAEHLFGSHRQFLRLDMSEFMHDHQIARLIGSPAGYAQSGQEGQLTGFLRSQPHSLVLLDEAEKAHPDVWDLFLQIFDEGCISDAWGRMANARHAIFIMTSNIGCKWAGRFGFGAQNEHQQREAILSDARAFFRKEFLNRIDDILVFRALSKEDAMRVARRAIRRKKAIFYKKHKIKIDISSSVIEKIVDTGYSAEYGVRPIHRSIEQYIDVPVANWLARKDIRESRSLRLELTGHSNVITV